MVVFQRMSVYRQDIIFGADVSHHHSEKTSKSKKITLRDNYLFNLYLDGIHPDENLSKSLAECQFTGRIWFQKINKFLICVYQWINNVFISCECYKFTIIISEITCAEPHIKMDIVQVTYLSYAWRKENYRSIWTRHYHP
jgi:hypothetical protein